MGGLPNSHLDDYPAHAQTGGKDFDLRVGVVVLFDFSVCVDEGETDDAVWGGPSYIPTVLLVGGWVGGWVGGVVLFDFSFGVDEGETHDAVWGGPSYVAVVYWVGGWVVDV